MSLFGSSTPSDYPFVKYAREIAMITYDDTLRQALRTAADALHEAIRAFTAEATAQNLATLNGAWACVQRHIELAQPMRPTPTIGGRATVTRHRELKAVA